RRRARSGAARGGGAVDRRRGHRPGHPRHGLRAAQFGRARARSRRRPAREQAGRYGVTNGSVHGDRRRVPARSRIRTAPTRGAASTHPGEVAIAERGTIEVVPAYAVGSVLRVGAALLLKAEPPTRTARTAQETERLRTPT